MKDLLSDEAPAAATPGKKPAAPKKGPSVAELQAALASPKNKVRTDAIRAFSKTGFGVDALPALRQALDDDDVNVALTAASCIASLGPAVASPDFHHLELYEQLIQTGGKVWSYSGYPNCYTACLEALVRLETDEDVVLEYVHNYIGLSNPDDLVASLEALKSLGTRDAIDLLKRAADFWMPELNVAEAKQVQAIADAVGRPKKK